MAVVLSLEQAPPFAAPLRFFLTAPLFGMAVAVLITVSGEELFASRWTPAALAATHLITVGFMLQIMIGALFQLLPVVAGAQMRRPLATARVVHALLAAGALLLAAAFLTQQAQLFVLAGALLGSGVLLFVTTALFALRGLGADSASVRDIRRALFGLTVTLAFGLMLVGGLAGAFAVPLPQVADIHLSWGLVGWGGVLLAGVAYVVVPMFQLTPAFPGWFERYFSLAVLVFLIAWSVLDLAGWSLAARLFASVVALAGGVLAAITLRLQTQSKRAKLDSTQQCWRFAMGSALAAAVLWLTMSALVLAGDSRPAWFSSLLEETPALTQFVDGSGWVLLCGVLVLVGAFMTAMNGMLYKIVPFLVWLHARNAGGRGTPAPNMRQVLGEPLMLRQARTHFLACALLVLAAFGVPFLALAGGVALFVAQALLLANLLKAAGVYRRHLRASMAAAAA